ncbi:MAG: phage tail protein [Bryobacteraceae bacterium]
MTEAFIGSIVLFAGNFAPRGWAFCQGQLLPIAQNAALFSILGTTYGGNGQTTFALPDLRGRAPIGAGQGPGLTPVTLGEAAGSETVALTAGQMPAHTHAVACDSASAGNADPANSYPGNPGTLSGAQLYGTAANATMAPNMITPAGGSQPFSIRQPYLGLNYIICLEGIFPSRN